MLRCSSRFLILFSGFLWFAVGFMLLYIGLSLLNGTYSSSEQLSYPILDTLKQSLGTRDNAFIVLTGFGLVLGVMKGRFILSRAATRTVNRIHKFDAPIPFFTAFGMRYFILIGLMVSLGMLMKWFQFPGDIRGVIDIGVGSGLIQGSMNYFRMTGFASNSRSV